METYIDKNRNVGREVNLGEKVVLDLLEGTDVAGRNVTCDNFFFTSLSLARKLLKKKVTLVGTIKKNLNFPRKWSAQRKESHSQQCLGCLGSSRTA